ncbi:MAG: DMT family transporter [Thaumarchaeota archaeon]|nr:DMT family transporter [Nitrososphaerota archaeon]
MASIKPYGLIVTLSVIWGLAFVAIRQADFELDSNNLTLLRWLIVAAAFLALYPVMVKPKARFDRKDFARLLVVALTSVAIYHLSLNAAEKVVNASLAGLLISLAPLTTVLLSSVVLHEKLTLKIWGALALAVAGAFVISSPDLSFTGTAVGPGLVVVAALAGAVFTVASKPLVSKYGPFPVAAWAAFLGTAILLPLATPSLVEQSLALSAQGWASVLYLAILSTVVANMIFYTLVSRQAVSKLGVQLYLVPIVSAAGGVLILGENLGIEILAGGALLLLAVGLGTSSRH